MTLLAITIYTGSEKLVEMTERMLRQLSRQLWDIEPTRLVAVNNGAVRQVANGNWRHYTTGKNLGFGMAVNMTIKEEMVEDVFTHVLILNNDLELNDEDWLSALLKEREDPCVLSPCTDLTATVKAQADRAESIRARRLAQVSAFCWLVPVEVIKAIKKRFGFELFDPDFFAYGEDDYTGAILRKLYGPAPFKVIPRSWVRHLKAQTGAEIGMHGGMKKNKDLLNRKMKKHRLT